LPAWRRRIRRTARKTAHCTKPFALRRAAEVHSEFRFVSKQIVHHRRDIGVQYRDGMLTLTMCSARPSPLLYAKRSGPIVFILSSARQRGVSARRDGMVFPPATSAPGRRFVLHARKSIRSRINLPRTTITSCSCASRRARQDRSPDAFIPAAERYNMMP